MNKSITTAIVIGIITAILVIPFTGISSLIDKAIVQIGVCTVDNALCLIELRILIFIAFIFLVFVIVLLRWLIKKVKKPAGVFSYNYLEDNTHKGKK